MSDDYQWEIPFSYEERCEIEAMQSHEVYLLTLMVPHGTLRAREVNDIYHRVIRREQEAGLMI